MDVDPRPEDADAARRGTPPVPSYLLVAILATAFCCLPAGVLAILYATQVKSKLQGGDRAGALAASKLARTWAWVSFGVGLVVLLVEVTLAVTGS